MKLIFQVAIGAVIAGSPCQPAIAGATRFALRQIVILGSTNVETAAINNKGAIVGGYLARAASKIFVLSGGVVTVLPPTPAGCSASCIAIPTAINAAGAVVGQTYFGRSYGFLRTKGAYVNAAAFGLGLGGGMVAGPGLNNRGQEFYNGYIGSGFYEPYFGTPGAMVQIKPPGSFPLIASINNHGVIAGTFAPYRPSVFVDRNSRFVVVTPPGAVATEGGFINDFDEVAGSYQDAVHVWHGFAYRGQKYASFDMPTKVVSIAVQAINNSGRIVGAYTDIKNVQHVFLYNGATVSVFGKYAPADQLHVALNDAGEMLLSDYSNDAYRSYRVRCRGGGC